MARAGLGRRAMRGRPQFLCSAYFIYNIGALGPIDHFLIVHVSQAYRTVLNTHVFKTFRTKLNVLTTCVFSTALYACETWTIKQTYKDKILAFEMYCYRRMSHLNWTMKVTNKEARKRLNIKTDLMQTIMKRKLGLFEHNMQNGEQQKNKKCDIGNYGWEGKTWKT